MYIEASAPLERVNPGFDTELPPISLIDAFASC